MKNILIISNNTKRVDIFISSLRQSHYKLVIYDPCNNFRKIRFGKTNSTVIFCNSDLKGCIQKHEIEIIINDNLELNGSIENCVNELPNDKHIVLFSEHDICLNSKNCRLIQSIDVDKIIEIVDKKPAVVKEKISYVDKPIKQQKQLVKNILPACDLKNCTVENINKTRNERYSYLDETNVNYTRPFNAGPKDFITSKSKMNINKIDDFILVLDFFNGGGGTTTFLNTIISKYKYYNNFVILRNLGSSCLVTLNDDFLLNEFQNESELIGFLNTIINKFNTVFVNHFLGFSQELITHIMGLKYKGKKLITVTHDYTHTHDYSNVYGNTPPTFDNFIHKNYIENNFYNMDMFDIIITQTNTNIERFSKFLTDSSKIQAVQIPDYYSRKQLICNNNSDHKNVIGIIGSLNLIKGSHILRELVTQYPLINFVVFGKFDCREPNIITNSYSSVNDLNTLLIKHKPMALLDLSIWCETYSFTLTLAILTGLPLLIYNKPFEGKSVIVERVKEANSPHFIFHNKRELGFYFDKYKQNSFYTIDTEIRYDRFWDKLFVKDFEKKPSPSEMTNKRLNKFFIYFPQFHSIQLNNINYYDGFTDIINLNKLYKSDYSNEMLTPNFDEFSINSTLDYDIVNNDNITSKQIRILQENNIDGLACYYYWFSTNTMTNENMVMKTAIDKLFEKSNYSGKKVFFIWANEAWSNNPSFANPYGKIENEYNESTLSENFYNLLQYFNQECYLKVNNKPVFMIYHMWYFNNQSEIELYVNRLNQLCIEHGFNGIELYLNKMNELSNTWIDSMKPSYQFKNFYINFNYKLLGVNFNYTVNDQKVLDYAVYSNYIENNSVFQGNNVVQTLTFDFDNHARLYEPNKMNLSTVCINNYHFNKVTLVKNILRTYNNNNETIVLINALNEWGEKMACEPSNEIGYYYINLINSLLC